VGLAAAVAVGPAEGGILAGLVFENAEPIAPGCPYAVAKAAMLDSIREQLVRAHAAAEAAGDQQQAARVRVARVVLGVHEPERAAGAR
jgi:hypothetical protein